MPPDPERRIRAVARDYRDGARVGEHCHAEGQVIHATAGVMEIRAERRLWLVPPRRALWMPPRQPHALRAKGAVSLRTLYIAPPDADRLGNDARGFAVSPLVSELILRLLDLEDSDVARCRRLSDVLFDELRDPVADTASIVLPADPRLARACDAIMASPGGDHGMEALASLSGASIRTLARLARLDLGCALSTWRQQARILAAIPMLIEGRSVIEIAHDLGCETPGAFAAMFKRFMGVTPREYRGVDAVLDHAGQATRKRTPMSSVKSK